MKLRRGAGVGQGGYFSSESDSAETSAFVRHPFIYANGVMTDLAPSAADGEARDINDLGQAVGALRNAAVLWDGGTVRDLNAAVSGSGSLALTVARAINDRGEIAGSGTLPAYPYISHAFVLHPAP